MEARRSLVSFILLAAALCINAHAEAREIEDEPADHSSLWKWSDAKPHHESVVMIRVGQATGTGVVLYVDKDSPQDDGYLGFCATANHVVDFARRNGEEIRVQYSNDKRDIASECSVVRRDRDLDVAVLWVWIPKNVEPARLATRRAKPGDPVEFVGLGGKSSLDQGLRHFDGKASAPTKGDFIYADQALLPGDSGGPIFDRRGRLLGVISGGWFWWSHDKIKTDYDQPLRATWPARGSNLIPLAKLISRLPSDKDGKCTASPGKRKKQKNRRGEMVAVLPVPHRQIAPTVTPEDIVVADNYPEWTPAVEGEIIYESSDPGVIIESEYLISEEVIE